MFHIEQLGKLLMKQKANFSDRKAYNELLGKLYGTEATKIDQHATIFENLCQDTIREKRIDMAKPVGSHTANSKRSFVPHIERRKKIKNRGVKPQENGAA